MIKDIQRDAMREAASIAGKRCRNECCEGGCSWCRAKDRAEKDIESAIQKI